MRYGFAVMLAAALGTGLGAAYAKLPPPSPQEQARKAQQEAEKKAQGERAKVELEQAQDKVVRRYHTRHPGTHSTARADEDKVKASDVPAGAKLPDSPRR